MVRSPRCLALCLALLAGGAMAYAQGATSIVVPTKVDDLLMGRGRYLDVNYCLDLAAARAKGNTAITSDGNIGNIITLVPQLKSDLISQAAMYHAINPGDKDQGPKIKAGITTIMKDISNILSNIPGKWSLVNQSEKDRVFVLYLMLGIEQTFTKDDIADFPGPWFWEKSELWPS